QLDLGALFTSPIVQYECPDGYTLRGSSCYKSVTSRQSWVNAENTCQGHGGHLTAVEGYSENLYVGAQILEDVKNDYDSPEVDDIDDCWLGFTGPNPAGSNEYDYADGRKATVFDGRWSDTQPNEEDGACVELHLYENNYPWYHSPCIQMSPFVCEIGACAEGEFRCTNGACINPDWVCDGTVDCGGGDFSDEIGCAEDCGGFQTGTSGTIQTSGYPDNNYDILQECVWIIEGPATSKIKIKFLDLVTEKDHDIVEVIDGPVYDASKVLATYSGTGTPDEVVITSTNSMTVKFHSDSTTTKSGFTADWEAIFSTCGGEFIAEVHKKNLSSTEYFEEKNYLNSEDCNWQLDSYSAQTVITLQFVTFETQEDTDMISVFDGEDAGAAHVLALFSGSELPNVVISSKHQMRVDFKSDDTVTMRGFHAWYWAGCQGIEIVRSHGYISTPGYGVNDYPGEIMCTWAIEEPSGKPLTLIFDDAFELELNTDADFVTVYDGIDDSGDILTGPWSGNSGTVTDGTLPPPNSRSENGMFYVVFTSSQQRNAMGFRARFSPDCPAIDIGDGVIASTNERGYGTVVQYSCLPGFTKPSRTVDSLTCEYGGEWNEGDNSKYPSCSRVRCGIPPDATNAFFYNVSSIAYQGVVSYRCVEGYTFSSSAMSMVCQANGTWGPEIPSCEPVVCPGPSMPDPMTYVVVGGGDDLIYGVTISFECPDGYNVIGFTSSICGSDGEWTADPGDCQRINCSELVITDLNMDATPDIGPYYAGDNITFICQSGYQIDGPTYITCNDDTQWSDSPPTCTDINECETDTDSCGLNQICQNTNGGYECLCVNGFEVDESGDSCSDINECADDDLNACNIYSECNNIDGGYTCDCFNGYILFTTDGTSGFYIPPGESGLSIGDMYVFNKSCVPLTCILPNINDAVVIPRTRTVYSIAGLLLIELNVTLTVICNPGYQLNGQNILTCQSDGEYDYNLPTCEAVSCGKPEDIANGMVQVSDPAYGYFSRSSYSCDSGYNIYGPTVRMCIKDGSEYKWSSYPPTCIAVDCGNVTLVTDGSWSYSNGSQYGSIATLTCDDGYGPLGDDERTCMEDGSWSGIPAQCTIIGVCDDPGMVQNGQRLGDDFSVGSTVSYTCDFGFTPTHYLSLICEGREVTVIPTIPTTTKEAESTTTTTTATTTEEEASSTTTTTTAPVATTTTTTTPPTTEEEASSTTTTTTAATTIITEEEASSTRTSTSARATTKTSTEEVTGSNRKRRDVQVEVDVVQEFLWNGTAPVCLDTSPPVIYCPESFLTLTDELEIDIIYPHATATDNVGIASITYEPPNGTTVSNVNYLTVTVTAQDMSGNEATCEFVAWVEPESCPDWSLETPEGGQKACTGLVPGLFGGYSCSLACPSGYDFIQEIGTPGNMYSCRLEGKWHPHNYVPDCVELEVPDYCLTIGGVYTATTSIPLSCTAYYESILEYIIQSLDPQLSVLCSDIADTVQIVLTDTSAMIDGQNVSASISMSVVALPGNTNRTAVSICGERIMDFILTSYNELSSILVIESQAATCPEIILQGSPTEEFQGCCCPQGSITRGCYCLTCTPGTFDDGDACLSCPIGTYQNMTGQTSCQQCPAGYSTLQEHTKNDEECRELCRPGFYSTNGVAPCRRCEIATFQSEYGSTSCTPCPNDTSTYGVAVSESSCRDFCEPGSFSNTGLSPCQQCPRHTYQNDSRATGCEPCPSGMGTLAPGSSSADLCVDYDICVELLPCLSGGTCSSYGPLNYTCECTNLYKGDRCELPALCDSGPCQNGGQCELRFSSYVCSCVDGYIGDLCEIDRDECAFDPCQNGATCNDLVGSYRCDCVPGYQGDQCDEETNECDGDPCDHEIYCEDLLNAFRCECEPGFEGVLCDENIDECAPGPCMNGATCQDGNNAYSCICPNGYEGSRCQNNIDDCIGVNCQNGGTCVDGLEEFTCDCVYGWGGEYCDEQSAPCYPDPCGNNATCVVLIDAEDYVCRCIYGYTGYYCEEEVDECGSNPCKNGANCTDLINSFECSCVAGFSGLTCDVNIDECANVPCENGGICTDLVNGYTCQCPTGYSGQNCDQDTDDCSGDPCENGATCQDAFNAFSCICAAGFEGEICDENINECDEFPCQNNATCIDTIGSYSCQCIDGFDGFFCDNNIDDCQDTCQNGATCHDGLMTFTCECLPAYDGVLCDKEKSADFDLFLTGTDMSMSLSTQYQCINDFSVSLWVRFANAGSTGTFFTIAVYGGENLANEVLIVLDQDVTGVNDGTWHHVALIVSEGAVAIFVDGAPVSSLSWTDVSDQDMCIIVLGQSYDENGALDEYFAFNGDLTQVNVHSQVLSLEDIQLLASNCSNPLGDVILWVQMDQDLTGNVQVVRPSQCGGTSCSIGHTGSDCNTVIDKVPPVVISCPNTTRIINPDSSLSVGEWEEPIFTDDVGVVRVEQTFAIGDTFSWGTYTIGYVAYDAANNSAQCNFLLYVLPFDCEYPDVPVNGLHVCSPFASGHFCVIECLPGKRFVTLPPPYYICGAEGTFDPQNSDVAFTFPGCAAPGRGNQGVNCQMRGNSNAGTCNQGIIGQLIQSFKDTMNYLNTLYGICGGECNFDDLVIECDSARRRKRQTGGSFVINYSFTSNATDVDPSLVIEVAVKDGNFTSGGITIDSDSLVVSTIVICENGSVLAYNNDACVQCPSGEYHDIDSDTCLPCEMGYYQPDEGQTECYKCPDNDITHGRRSIDVSQCVARCTAGHYYDSSASQCEPCKRGYWQDKEGKFVCNTCTKGMLTDEEGATNASQCLEVCKSVGIQLGVSGECEPCQKGTYRSDVDQQVSCIMCPFGFTTEESGADSIDLCNVADCNVGWYLNNGVCEKCPLGTYNPLRHQDRCQSCPEYYTTNTEGALFESECVDAHECRLGTDDCSENAVCRNTVPGYTCTCLPGYMGDGKDCLDVCFDYCFNDGLCEKDSYGNASCNCKRGFKGDRCEVKMGSTSPGISDGQTAIVIGAVAGGVAAILVLGVIILLIYKRFSLSSKEHPGWETQEATMDWVFDDIEDNGDVIDKLKKEEESFNEIFHYNPMYSESAGGSSVDITHKSGSMRTFKSQDESVPDNDAYF
uniref:Uncharacterized protein LOC100378937 n=1 Tax=Saccoglossus kowalevskii TaxID=10224 RepID=A0ABM0MZ98_SACKO